MKKSVTMGPSMSERDVKIDHFIKVLYKVFKIMCLQDNAIMTIEPHHVSATTEGKKLYFREKRSPYP